MHFTADFETTTNADDCRVWATGICSISPDYNFYYGNSIDFLFEFARQHEMPTFYFHNLRFDGEFIINYLFENGYKHVTKRKFLKKGCFTSLISDMGQFYSIEVCTNKTPLATEGFKLLDSHKILPFSIADIAKAFNLPILKGNIDYHRYRDIDYNLDNDEVLYLKNDVEIPARALSILFSQDLKKMTQGSNAMYDFKKIFGSKRFERAFPVLDYETDGNIRLAYRGGFTFLNDKYKNVDVDSGIVFDVNSLYPWIMYSCPMPYGEPVYFKGEYQNDELYNLFIVEITCNFELKKGFVPTIQLKNNLSFVATDYIKSSNGERVTLNLTNVDLQLFLKHYDVSEIEYGGGWKFKSTTEMFKEYIKKWYKIKLESKEQGNSAMYTLAKLMLNAFYGKFGLNPNVCSKIPTYEDGKVVYKLGEKETRTPVYIPVAVFTTSNARHMTITSAQQNYERFIYADTDSLHLEGDTIPDNLLVDDGKLGAWKLESRFIRARFIRQKSYIEEEIQNTTFYLPDKTIFGNTKLKVTCAGMPKQCHEHVSWDNFREGNSFAGKLQMTRVKGGIVLKDIDFSIKK